MPDFALYQGGPAESASNPAASTGIAVTTGGANTKGSWVEAIAATTYDTGWVVAAINPQGNANIVDIGIGASTAEAVIVPDLWADVVVANTQRISRVYAFPFSIPKGSRVALRAQASGASEIPHIGLTLVAGTLRSGAGCSRAESFGQNTALTRLLQIDPGGTAHTDSAWGEMIASTAFPYRWVCVAFGHRAGAATNGTTWLVDLAIGGSGSEVVLIEDMALMAGQNVDNSPSVFSLPVNIPAGSRIAARARTSDTGSPSRAIDVGGWGFG